jgi:hypothetical protein
MSGCARNGEGAAEGAALPNELKIVMRGRTRKTRQQVEREQAGWLARRCPVQPRQPGLDHDDVSLDLPDGTGAVDPGGRVEVCDKFPALRAKIIKSLSVVQANVTVHNQLNCACDCQPSPEAMDYPLAFDQAKFQSRAPSAFKTALLRRLCPAPVRRHPTTRPRRLKVRSATGAHSSIESPAPNITMARCSSASSSAHEMPSIARLKVVPGRCLKIQTRA